MKKILICMKIKNVRQNRFSLVLHEDLFSHKAKGNLEVKWPPDHINVHSTAAGSLLINSHNTLP